MSVALLASLLGYGRIPTPVPSLADAPPGQGSSASFAGAAWLGTASVHNGDAELELMFDESGQCFLAAGDSGGEIMPMTAQAPAGHDLRLAAGVRVRATPGVAPAVRLDLRRLDGSLAGRVALADWHGAEIDASWPEGGRADARVRDYVTYPVEFLRYRCPVFCLRGVMSTCGGRAVSTPVSGYGSNVSRLSARQAKEVESKYL